MIKHPITSGRGHLGPGKRGSRVEGGTGVVILRLGGSGLEKGGGRCCGFRLGLELGIAADNHSGSGSLADRKPSRDGGECLVSGGLTSVLAKGRRLFGRLGREKAGGKRHGFWAKESLGASHGVPERKPLPPLLETHHGKEWSSSRVTDSLPQLVGAKRMWTRAFSDQEKKPFPPHEQRGKGGQASAY